MIIRLIWPQILPKWDLEKSKSSTIKPQMMHRKGGNLPQIGCNVHPPLGMKILCPKYCSNWPNYLNLPKIIVFISLVFKQMLHFRSTRSISSYNAAEISSMASSQNLPAVLNDPRKGMRDKYFSWNVWKW